RVALPDQAGGGDPAHRDSGHGEQNPPPGRTARRRHGPPYRQLRPETEAYLVSVSLRSASTRSSGGTSYRPGSASISTSESVADAATSSACRSSAAVRAARYSTLSPVSAAAR